MSGLKGDLRGHRHQHQMRPVFVPLSPTRQMYRTNTIRTIMFNNIDFINFLHKCNRNRDIIDFLFCPYSKNPLHMVGLCPLINLIFRFGRNIYVYNLETCYVGHLLGSIMMICKTVSQVLLL